MAGEFVDLRADGKLKKCILTEGSGSSPTKGSTVSVHYTGTLYPSGVKFDSSRDRDAHFSFKLGEGQVIAGWDIGIATMKVGEVCQLLIDSELAYGSRGSPPTIPPNSTLMFEVELFSFEAVPQTPEEIIEFACKAKDTGNSLFKSGDYVSAREAYKKGKGYLIASEQTSESRALGSILDANVAFCCLKLKEYAQARQYCSSAIALDPNNPKSFYRLGLALSGLCEWDDSVKAFEEALKLSPAEEKAAIQTELKKVSKLRQEHSIREKGIYQKMFA